MWQEIFFNVLQGKVDFVEFVIAGVTIPKQTVLKVQMIPSPFDYQADGIGVSLGGVRHFCRVQVHVPRAQFQRLFASAFLNVYLDSPFQLEEQLFSFIVMIVLSCIGPGDDHDDIISGFLIEVPVAYWRL
jgi:hypothetical protein